MCNLSKLIELLLSMCMCIGIYMYPLRVEVPTVSTAEPTEPTVISTEPPVEPSYEYIDILPMINLPENDSLKTIYEAESIISECHTVIAEYDKLLSSISEEHPQYNDIVQSKTLLLGAIDEYSSLLDRHWKSREEKHPVMTYIWRDLRKHGWSDEVVAGIIGNLIAEAGGMGYQDIDWQTYSYDNNGNLYYGICQWALKYVSELHTNSSLDNQLDYLKSSIKRELNTLYSRSFRDSFGLLELRYDDFVKIDNPHDAAIAFAVCYERCASRYVTCRGPLAEKTYEYFINFNSWPWP